MTRQEPSVRDVVAVCPRTRGIPLLLTATIASFVAACLVFSMQPMTTRMLLPRLGGSAAVWNTAMVFFQIGLLAGYALTHLTTSRCSPRGQVIIHCSLLAAAALVLPLDVADRFEPPTTGSPALWMIGVLAATVGLPYLALTSVSPLVQRWFSLSSHARSADPYFLYAASNAGSLLGLLMYPLLVERLWSLDDQARAWTAGYAFFAAALVGLVLLSRMAVGRRANVGPSSVHPEVASASWRERARWLGYAFVPSSLMLGVTTHITTDIASVPLFWVVPLAIYLLTHIVAFGARRGPSRSAADRLLLPTVGVAVATFVGSPPPVIEIVVHLAVLAAAGLAFHVRLAESRPVAGRLTDFFVCISIGGALGGAFNALIAPVVFDRVLEYALVLVVATFVVTVTPGYKLSALAVDLVAPCVAIVAVVVLHGSWPALLVVAGVAFAVLRRRVVAVVATACVLALGSVVATSADAVLHSRGFYGAFHVREGETERSLVHGTTTHGVQLLDPRMALEPTSYYTRSGPLGQVFETYGGAGHTGNVAVIGLGAGTVAAYSEPGRAITFFEIDPAIRDLANDPDVFTFLRDAKGPVDVVIGDGRLALSRRLDTFDLVVIDAFSSDAVPVHLMTREAVEVYLRRAGGHGLVAFHISNRYVDLEPVLAAIADDLELAALSLEDREISPADEQVLKSASHWVVLARSAADLEPLAERGWLPVDRRGGVGAWSDDYADLVSVLAL